MLVAPLSREAFSHSIRPGTGAKCPGHHTRMKKQSGLAGLSYTQHNRSFKPTHCARGSQRKCWQWPLHNSKIHQSPHSPDRGGLKRFLHLAHAEAMRVCMKEKKPLEPHVCETLSHIITLQSGLWVSITSLKVLTTISRPRYCRQVYRGFGVNLLAKPNWLLRGLIYSLYRFRKSGYHCVTLGSMCGP